MKVYLERKDIPDFCTECPFQINDTCMLQGDGTRLDFDTWDEMYAGCPLRAVEDYWKEHYQNER